MQKSQIRVFWDKACWLVDKLTCKNYELTKVLRKYALVFFNHQACWLVDKLWCKTCKLKIFTPQLVDLLTNLTSWNSKRNIFIITDRKSWKNLKFQEVEKETNSWHDKSFCLNMSLFFQMSSLLTCWQNRVLTKMLFLLLSESINLRLSRSLQGLKELRDLWNFNCLTNLNIYGLSNLNIFSLSGLNILGLYDLSDLGKPTSGLYGLDMIVISSLLLRCAF